MCIQQHAFKCMASDNGKYLAFKNNNKKSKAWIVIEWDECWTKLFAILSKHSSGKILCWQAAEMLQNSLWLLGNFIFHVHWIFEEEILDILCSLGVFFLLAKISKYNQKQPNNIIEKCLRKIHKFINKYLWWKWHSWWYFSIPQHI